MPPLFKPALERITDPSSLAHRGGFSWPRPSCEALPGPMPCPCCQASSLEAGGMEGAWQPCGPWGLCHSVNSLRPRFPSPWVLVRRRLSLHLTIQLAWTGVQAHCEPAGCEEAPAPCLLWESKPGLLPVALVTVQQQPEPRHQCCLLHCRPRQLGAAALGVSGLAHWEAEGVELCW
uniref:Uncharacterized protein n=1 Tax=Myotis myotis TaxID=51298 RepID=A0A7J7VIJ5_MYOMY|nr:hypothetical protein mMyoMyo1_008404 [Myotis myotis]